MGELDLEAEPEPGKYGIITILLLLGLFIAVVVGVIAITESQRRIPTQSAKHVRGRRVFGGTEQYLPLKVNQAGVMPIIFASSLLIFPSFVFSSLARATSSLRTDTWTRRLVLRRRSSRKSPTRSSGKATSTRSATSS